MPPIFDRLQKLEAQKAWERG